jgi:hypothetical protein
MTLFRNHTCRIYRNAIVETQTQSYCPDTDETAFSMTDEEPHIYEEDSSTGGRDLGRREKST